MQQRPIGICSICGNYAFHVDEVEGHCKAHHHGEACNGIVRDAHAEKYWEACPLCAGKSDAPSIDCPQCAGKGWLYVAD